jgi:hypothetical protein
VKRLASTMSQLVLPNVPPLHCINCVYRQDVGIKVSARITVVKHNSVERAELHGGARSQCFFTHMAIDDKVAIAD